MVDIGTNRSGLRLGYTTGSCAAAAAKAAVWMLLGGEEICQVRLMTPKGIELWLDIENITRAEKWVQCAVRKYSGDDPDVTDGMLVFVRAERQEEEGTLSEQTGERAEVLIEGGEGIGRVTRPGLEQKVGQAAINRVPRRMIRDEVLFVCEKYGFTGCMKVTVSIPGGEERAKKTFNSRLGIEGGLSVLGTTGIVEPMSEKALTDTIYLAMKVIRESGSPRCFVTPGNFGNEFLKDHLLAPSGLCVTCSNYIGEAIDFANMLEMKGILLVGHMGKFIKLAAGVMNTHSRQADCRMEVLAAYGALAGADQTVAEKVMRSVTTSEAVGVLREAGLLQPVLHTVMERTKFYLDQRAGEELEVEAIMFSLEDGIQAGTSGADRLLEKIRRQLDRKEGEEKI